MGLPCCHCWLSQSLFWDLLSRLDIFSNRTERSQRWFGNLEVSVIKLIKLSVLITAVWGSSQVRASLSHTMRGGESVQSGSHEPLPLTTKVWAVPSAACDSLSSHKSAGCHGIFRCLLSVAEEKSVSCIQARKIIQEMNAPFVESRKRCRVNFFPFPANL